MSNKNTISRRDFIEAVAVAGAVGLSACAASSQPGSKLWAVDRASGKLPPRGEFIVRNAYVVSMDPKIGDIASGDVHVRNGAIIGVGPKLDAPGVEEIDGRNRAARFHRHSFSSLGQLRARHRRRRRFRLFPGHEPARAGDDTGRRL